VTDGNTDKKRAKKRAKHRRDRAAGNSRRASISQPGWRDDGGQLWAPGNKSWVESAFLDLKQDMLIEQVDYLCDGSGGSSVKLVLVDPRAFNGKEGKAASSGDGWGMDTSEPTEE
jgi:prophage tail gpP-like protein